ncbi:MAG: PIN domain-containing protein [Bacteroidetes bacterium]|nr:PIN domain-containing protein [Bacteroidota bacterium]
MRNSVLVDAGPLIALFDRSDRHHLPVRQLLRDQRFNLVTTWPVVTEASHILRFDVNCQLALLTWIERKGLGILDIGWEDVGVVREMVSKYRNVPMDLADATLVYAAEKYQIMRILTMDSDFHVYRTQLNATLKAIFVSQSP